MPKAPLEIQKEIKAAHRILNNWDAVAAYFTNKTGVRLTKPLLWRIANKGYEPKNPAIRNALGYPVSVCPNCGVPVSTQPTDLFSMPLKMLRDMLKNRREL